MNNSESFKNRYVVIAVAILIIGVAYIYKTRMVQTPSSNQNQMSGISTSTTFNINLPESHVKTVKIDSSAKKITAPVLDREIPASTATMNGAEQAYRTQTIGRLNKTVDALKKDQYSYQDWIYLGLYRQILGDYEGALQVWRYATFLAPSEEVAFLNLANLYATNLKDYAQAESYYQKALEINPADTGIYRNLADMYRYNYKQGTSAAEDILKKGIKSNPDALDLYVILARYFGDTGRVPESRAEYGEAIALAKKQNNLSAATELETEQAALK